MNKCTCLQCGWDGLASLCYNGEYEPPTCCICESSSLSYYTEDNNNEIINP